MEARGGKPHRLARDIRGIGFRTADAIATKLGIEKTAMVRVRAGIAYALTEAMDEGHCGLPVDELGPLAVAASLSERATLNLAWRYTDLGEVWTGRGTGRVVWRDGSREPLPLDLAPTRARLAGHGVRVSLRYGF